MSETAATVTCFPAPRRRAARITTAVEAALQASKVDVDKARAICELVLEKLDKGVKGDPLDAQQLFNALGCAVRKLQSVDDLAIISS